MTRATACLALCALAGLLGTSGSAAGATVQGWGFNNNAQVGTGATSLNGCRCITAPANVIGLKAPTQIAPGPVHTISLQSDGTVMAWGNNEQGQLGDGTTASTAVPKQIPGLTDVVAIAAGGQFNLALLENGTVLAWGGNSGGGLGTGNTTGPGCAGTCNPNPAAVPGLTNVIAISASDRGGALALRADGTVMAWGTDDSGQVGDGTGVVGGCKCIPTPQPVPGVSGAMAISAGGFGGMALLADGSVESWGANNDGQLGTGSVTPPAPNCTCFGPTKTAVSAVSAVSAGSLDGLALTAAGEVQTWGINFLGQLGNGVVSQTPACTCVATPTAATGVSGARAIAAGEDHGLALLSNGGVESWGSNFTGQLGNGNTELANPTPTPVPGLTGAVAVFAGGRTSFALLGGTRPLKISFSGSGAALGAVGGAGLLCHATCTTPIPLGQVVNLRAEGSGRGKFVGFTETCQGTTPCQVAMNVLHDVTATFGAPTGTRIARAKIDSRARSALFTFTAPQIGVVTGFECALVKPARGHKAKKGGRNPHFARCKAPVHYRHLAPGRYTFEVRALDVAGADPRPAMKKFTIARRR